MKYLVYMKEIFYFSKNRTNTFITVKETDTLEHAKLCRTELKNRHNNKMIAMSNENDFLGRCDALIKIAKVVE